MTTPAMTTPGSTARHPRLRIRSADMGRLASAWLVSTLALMVANWLMEDIDSTSPWAWAQVALIAGVVGLVLRPVMVRLSAWIGWLAVLAVALVGQAVIMYVAMQLVPAVTAATFGAALLAAWIAAVVGTAVSYLTTAGSDDGLVHSLKRRGELAARDVVLDDPEVDGVVFVQLDGVPYPVLRWAVQAGGVPNIRRWLAAGDYTLREWTAQLPCTTPASQMGILHGTIDAIPAFRWYDRDLERVIVANRPPDARVIEERSSDGRGLLYDNGVSISNMFTGDAERSLLTMSRTQVGRGSQQSRAAFAWFFATPIGFARSLTRTVVEIVKERFQARRQVRRDLQPRVHRGWTFAALRAVTNALLRDVNLSLVAQEMSRGTKSIYVDFVDYDEIAHHAGIFRPESLAALDGLDTVLASLHTLAQGAPRKYHIVALSDHGQSQGTTFKDRYGLTLGDLCQQLMAEQVATHDQPVEGLGRAESLVGDMGPKGLSGRVAGQVEERLRKESAPAQTETDIASQTHVFGSGNLGLVYLRGDHRHTLEELEQAWPALVPGLAAHPGVAFVAVLDDAGRHWAIGPEGRRHLETGEVEGVDPLARFRPGAAAALLRATCMPEAPDLYVNSLMDEGTEDIAAFEELVGAHGGLGGWQDRGILLVPAAFTDLIPSGLEGADEVHRALVGVLRHLGHRRDEAADDLAEVH